MKRCSKCKIEKQENMFSPSQFLKESGMCNYCWRSMPSQSIEGKRKYRSKNKDKVKKWKQKDYIKNRKQCLLRGAKQRAKNNNLEFTITEEHIIFPHVCPILDIPIIVEAGEGRTGNGPSIDRIDNTKGYIPNNIIIISDRANTLKSDSTQEEREKIFNFYKRIIYDNLHKM